MPRLKRNLQRFLAFSVPAMNGRVRYIIDEDLLSILRGKLKSEELTAGVESLMAAAAVLRERRLTASHFGNGGEVANLLSEAKLRKEKRRGDGSIASRQAVGRCNLVGFTKGKECTIRVAWSFETKPGKEIVLYLRSREQLWTQLKSLFSVCVYAYAFGLVSFYSAAVLCC